MMIPVDRRIGKIDVHASVVEAVSALPTGPVPKQGEAHHRREAEVLLLRSSLEPLWFLNSSAPDPPRRSQAPSQIMADTWVAKQAAGSWSAGAIFSGMLKLEDVAAHLLQHGSEVLVVRP